MAITVRRVEEADLEYLRANQARPDLNLVDAHFKAQEAGDLIFAVAVEDDTLLGTTVLDYASEDLKPELRNMWVYPHARRKGAGRALSEWLEEEARQAGHESVYLAVDPNNEKAVPLYVSLEYHPTGEHLFVDDPEVEQVEDGQQASSHYAIYMKSLTAR
ncbi:MAG: GNAT family N-acetyltransferase [Propionibacteriaceae bacterium]|nr:GNAT family N-acetyltransferase [Propionibacteriaceae bacterium]